MKEISTGGLGIGRVYRKKNAINHTEFRIMLRLTRSLQERSKSSNIINEKTAAFP